MSEATDQLKDANEVKRSLRVLVVEDSEFDARMLIGLLKAGGFKPIFKRVETASEMNEALSREEWEVILADYNLPEFSAPKALEVLRDTKLDIPFIIVSGGIGEDTAVSAMRAGAHDYLMKGNLARLVPAVERELRDAEVRVSRRKAIKELRESEMRHRSLIENASDIIVVLDSKGVVSFISPACEKVLGKKEEDLNGRDWFDLAEKSCRDQLRNEYYRSLSQELDSFSFEGRFIDMNGDSRVLDATAQNLLNNEAIAGVVLNVRDVTDRQQTQAVIRESEEEFRVAREIQQHLFPKQAPSVDGFDIAGASSPAAATGGDYFDYLQTPDGQLVLAVADVSGHGAGPAMLMAETRAYLRLLTRNRHHLGEILVRANNMVGEDVGKDRFITMQLVKLDTDSKTIVHCSAGHTPGHIIGEKGAIKDKMKRTGIALGVTPDAAYEVEGPSQLEKGDIILLQTDGLAETVNAEGELFGVQRVIEELHSNRDLSAAEIVDSIFEKVACFSEGAEQEDDYTMIVVKVL
jgi:PAS domain S-box-containing protein